MPAGPIQDEAAVSDPVRVRNTLPFETDAAPPGRAGAGAHFTAAVKTSSIARPVRQPGAGSVFARESVQMGWATPP